MAYNPKPVDAPPTCDLCAEESISWSYPVEPGQVLAVDAEHTLVSGDSWVVGDACHQLIQSMDTEALINRAVDGICTRNHITDRRVRAELAAAATYQLAQFLTSRRGDPVAV